MTLSVITDDHCDFKGMALTLATKFTTASARDGAKLKAWRHYLGEVYYSLDVRSDNADMRGTMTSRRIGFLGMSRLSVSENKVRRTRQSIARDHIEEFCFAFPLGGWTIHRQYGIESIASRGDIFCLNASDPFEVHHSDGAELICLTLPCSHLLASFPHIDSKNLRKGIRNDAVGDALMQLVGGAITHDVQAEAEKVESLVTQMLVTILHAHKAQQSGSFPS